VDPVQLLILLVIVGICGAIAEWIVGYNPGGLLLSVIVGVIGAYLGSWLGSLVPFLELPLTIVVGTVTFNLIWAIVGSILLLLLLYLMRPGERRELYRGRWLHRTTGRFFNGRS
jgi:uncharacterized membrane protein YeaQ/YmgE (transglycosylase-associated protein family)